MGLGIQYEAHNPSRTKRQSSYFFPMQFGREHAGIRATALCQGSRYRSLESVHGFQHQDHKGLLLA